jgi:hypothetical protein
MADKAPHDRHRTASSIRSKPNIRPKMFMRLPLRTWGEYGYME